MISARNILTWPKRRWRAGGFGIHSPFAFAFVTRVLAKKQSPDIKKQLRAIAGKEYRLMSLLYRCIKHFKPKVLSITNIDDYALIERIIDLAGTDTTITTDNADATHADMAIVGTSGTPLLRDNGADVYIISRIDRKPYKSFWKSLNANCQHGMDFSNRYTGIICRFSHLPRQSFKIVFK